MAASAVAALAQASEASASTGTYLASMLVLPPLDSHCCTHSAPLFHAQAAHAQTWPLAMCTTSAATLSTISELLLRSFAPWEQ